MYFSVNQYSNGLSKMPDFLSGSNSAVQSFVSNKNADIFPVRFVI